MWGRAMGALRKLKAEMFSEFRKMCDEIRTGIPKPLGVEAKGAENRPRASKEGGCFICGENSHWARECPIRKAL